MGIWNVTPEELIEIGLITKPWGIRGEVKIILITDIPDRFQNLEGVFLHDGEGGVEYYRVENFKNLKGAVAAKLQGIDTPEDAEHLRGYEVAVPESERAPLQNGEYYIYDLIGLEAVDPGGKPLGHLSKVYQGSAQDIFEINTPDGPVMVPAVGAYIQKVDLDNRIVVLILPHLED